MISSYEHCLQCVQDVRSRRTLFFGAVDQAKVHRHRVSMKLCGSHYRRSQICCARQALKSLGDHKWEQRFPGFAKRLASAGNTISVPPWCSPTPYTRLHKPLPLFFGSVGSVCSITVPRAALQSDTRIPCPGAWKRRRGPGKKCLQRLELLAGMDQNHTLCATKARLLQDP